MARVENTKYEKLRKIKERKKEIQKHKKNSNTRGKF